jgi:hypothetical protein
VSPEAIGPLGLHVGQRARRTQTVTAREADKPVCQLRATIVNQDGTVFLEGECWTYTLRPA